MGCNCKKWWKLPAEPKPKEYNPKKDVKPENSKPKKDGQN
jgi:hypothetical protein